MKREIDEDINWGKLFFKVILAFVIVILIIWGISKFVLNRDSNASVSEFEDNLNKMFEVSEKYFEDDKKLPSVGNHATITLKEMIEKELIDVLKDGKNVCSTKSSYAKVSNDNGKYTLKVLLTCGSESDYISKVIKIDEDKEETKTDSEDKVVVNDNNDVVVDQNNSNSNSSNNDTVEVEKVVVTDYTKMEYKFCKIENNEYYTVVYLNSNDLVKKYETTYTIKLNDLNNASKIEVLDDSYFLSNKYYDKYKKNLDSNFTVINGSSAKDVVSKSKKFVNASLKSNNFDYKLTNVYEKDNSYYIDVEIIINKVSKYYDSYNDTKINYIPIYFNISYADLDNCVKDTYANSSKYNSYYVVK